MRPWASQLLRAAYFKHKANDIWKKPCLSFFHLPMFVFVGVAVRRLLIVVPLAYGGESKNYEAPFLNMTRIPA
jgi:hypothetical protein